MIRPLILLSLLAALIAPSVGARAQTDDFPASPPPDAPASTVKPSVLLRETLPNGLRVVIQENHRIPAVEMKMGIRAGQVADPIDNPYMAQMAVQLIDQGTEKYNAEKRDKAALAMGGDLGIELQEDYVSVSASCLSNYSSKMLDLMSDMILRPKLDRDLMDAYTLGLSEAVKRHVFPRSTDESKGRQAYAKRYPTAETVKRLDRDHLVEFLDNYYCPNNSILVICGDINAEAMLRQVKADLGAWKRGDTPPLPTFVKEEIIPFYRVYLEDSPRAVESNIQMVINVPGLDDKDRVSLELANVIMGETLDSRLFRSVREKYGYVYSIGSGVHFNAYATQFYVITECRTAVTTKTVKQIEIEVRRLREEPVSEADLEQSKHYLIHKYDRAEQSQAQATEELFEVEFYKRPADYFRRVQSRITAQTAADVLRVARRYMFPDDSAFIQITGNKEHIVDRLMNANVGVILNPDSE